ncbi:MAG: hypothetical protein JKP90_16425 [Desulfofustis sp. PB-SRB1]|nr:hypothetical protein [Desulfofustis sp. PB-SRB1]
MKSSPGTPGVTADWHIPHATTKAAEKKISAAFLIPSRPFEEVINRLEKSFLL